MTLDLHPAVCVHSLVSTQIGELGVGLVAHLAPEGLHAAVDVCVLLEPGGGGECLATLWTGVTPGPDMRGPDVSLQVAGVSEHLVTVLAGESPELTVHHLVSEQVGPPGKPFIAMFANIFICLISMILNHVLVKSKTKKNSFLFLKIFYVKLTYKRQEKIYRRRDI